MPNTTTTAPEVATDSSTGTSLGLAIGAAFAAAVIIVLAVVLVLGWIYHQRKRKAELERCIYIVVQLKNLVCSEAWVEKL